VKRETPGVGFRRAFGISAQPEAYKADNKRSSITNNCIRIRRQQTLLLELLQYDTAFWKSSATFYQELWIVVEVLILLGRSLSSSIAGKC